MDVQKEVKSLRESMNMNRREFCEYWKQMASYGHIMASYVCIC